jgi:hypothetical protein
MAAKSPFTGWMRAAAVAWLLVAGYAYVIAPRGALSLALFFVLLYAALAATLVPLCRVAGRWGVPRPLRSQVPSAYALRQGLLLALFIVGNLALLAARAWNPVMLVFGALALGIEEAVALARK